MKEEIIEFIKNLPYAVKASVIELEKKKGYERQVELQEEIQGSGYNVVTCHTCGTVLFHTRDEGECVTICHDCGDFVYFNDCPDLYYQR